MMINANIQQHNLIGGSFDFGDGANRQFHDGKNVGSQGHISIGKSQTRAAGINQKMQAYGIGNGSLNQQPQNVLHAINNAYRGILPEKEGLEFDRVVDLK